MPKASGTAKNANSVSAAYAKAHLPQLIKDAENGKTTIISRYKKPVAVISCSGIVAARTEIGYGEGTESVSSIRIGRPL